MDQPNLEIGPDAISQAAGLGISNEMVIAMARYSAPYTSDDGNRRYEKYVLLIEDGVINGIHREGQAVPPYEKTERHITRRAGHPFAEVVGEGEGFSEITCPDCNGDGDFCMTCNSEGKIRVRQVSVGY